MSDSSNATTLPVFKYFADPVAAKVFEEDPTAVCPCCEKQTGWIYTMEPYGEDEIEDICPWCIADGSAAEKFDVVFNDTPSDVPDDVASEIEERTPEFPSWQQGMWLSHCDDACVFVGSPDWEQLQQMPDICQELLDIGHTEAQLRMLGEDSPWSAYVFTCLHCGEQLVYSDSD